MKNLERTRGISLIELLITLSIIGICLLFISNLQDYLEQKRLLIIKTDLTKAIFFASNEALVLKQKISLEPLKTWSEGLIIKLNNQTLHQWYWNFPNINLSFKGANKENKIIFSPTLAERMSNGTFTIRSTYNKDSQVIINKIGFITDL